MAALEKRALRLFQQGALSKDVRFGFGSFRGRSAPLDRFPRNIVTWNMHKKLIDGTVQCEIGIIDNVFVTYRRNTSKPALI